MWHRSHTISNQHSHGYCFPCNILGLISPQASCLCLQKNDSIHCWHLLAVREPVGHGQVVGFYFLMDKLNSQGSTEVSALWFL